LGRETPFKGRTLFWEEREAFIGVKKGVLSINIWETGKKDLREGGKLPLFRRGLAKKGPSTNIGESHKGENFKRD